MRLTTAAVEGLKLDAGVADKIIFDDDVPGFGIRVRASGARTWIFQYKIGGRTRRLVLGQVSAIKLAKARDIASELHAKVRLGGDPASEKREKVQRALNTFGALAERFLDQYARRPRTRYEVSPGTFENTPRRYTRARRLNHAPPLRRLVGQNRQGFRGRHREPRASYVCRRCSRGQCARGWRRQTRSPTRTSVRRGRAIEFSPLTSCGVSGTPPRAPMAQSSSC